MENSNFKPFANELKSQLPQILQEVVRETSSDTEADLMLMGAITTLSAAIPNVYGIYDENVVYPNLYLFVSAKASAGKGRLATCKNLIMPIHNELRNNPLTNGQSLLIPANCSATAMYQQLSLNDGKGLIFESEADSLNNALRSSYGNFSDGLRKAFHHETISYLRRKENEWVEINNPHISIVLSGTPNQCKRLIPNAENGLFSRFAIMNLDSNNTWKNVFDKQKKRKNAHFDALALKVHELHKRLRCQEHEIEFDLTDKQKEKFNAHFNSLQNSLIDDDNFSATIRRMGIITFRIAMILSALRIKSKRSNINKIICSDIDFESALKISKSLLEHANFLYKTLPEGKKAIQNKTKKAQQMANLLEMMPETFSRKEMFAISQPINISLRTIDNYLTDYLKDNKIECIGHGIYRKIESTPKCA
jgi:hypothetical protein